MIKFSGNVVNFCSEILKLYWRNNMAQTYPKTFKNCSTCQSWEGDREINTSDGSISVVSPSSKGECAEAQDQAKMAFMSCPKWLAISG